MKEIIDLTFKLSLQGIHLTRNKFTYRLICYDEIVNASLVKGKSVKNWQIIMLLGVILLLLSIYLSLHLLGGLWVDEKPVRFYNVFGHGLILLFVIAGIGIISLFNALKTVPVILIETRNGTFKLRILKNQKNIIEIVNFLRSIGIHVTNS